MSAVRAAVQHAGGHLKVRTERGKFTCITLHLPKSEFLYGALRPASELAVARSQK
jgi:chemotaxis protein histidine kinase CheA